MPTLRLDADAKKGVKAFQDLEKAIDKTEKQLELTTREAKKLETAAGRIAKQNEGPQERYNRKMQELANLVKQGKLSMDQAHMAATRYGASLERAGQKGQSVWGQQALAGIGGLVSGYLSVAGAVGVVAQGLRVVDQETRKVADSFYQGFGSIGELQQVSKTPADFAKNLGYAKSLVSRGIVSNLGEASQIAFTTAASGFTDAEREFLAKVGEKKQVAPEKLLGFAENIGTVQSLYPGTSLGFAADKLTAGAESIKKGGFAETATQIAKFASKTNTLGFSGDEAIAALVMAENQGVPLDTAGTQVAALFTAIDSLGLNKGTLRSSLAGIESRISGGETAKAVLGNVRAVDAYRAVQGNLGKFDSIVGGLANAQGALATRDFIGSDPLTLAASLKEAAIGRDASKLLDGGSEKELLLDAVAAELKASGGGINRAATYLETGLVSTLGTENIYFREVLSEDRNVLTPQLVSALESYLERIANNTEKAETTTRQE